MKYHTKKNRGVLLLTIFKNGTIVNGTWHHHKEEESGPDFFDMHAWLLWLSWGIFGMT